jgi:hypothetical protein
MANRKKRNVNLGILIFFLLSISFANFFHTEKSPLENDHCPACNLLKSTQATTQIHFFYMAELRLLEILPIIESFHYSHITIIQRSSRSPPQVG